VVLLVDAFTVPSGARRKPDPRGLVSYLVDTNITDAVDSLLQANRTRLVSEFDLAELRWNDRDCRDDSRNLPRALCDEAGAQGAQRRAAAERPMVFYHLGFDDVLPRQDDQSPPCPGAPWPQARAGPHPTALQTRAPRRGLHRPRAGPRHQAREPVPAATQAACCWPRKW
jgi:hypothetical protein